MIESYIHLKISDFFVLHHKLQKKFETIYLNNCKYLLINTKVMILFYPIVLDAHFQFSQTDFSPILCESFFPYRTRFKKV